MDPTSSSIPGARWRARDFLALLLLAGFVLLVLVPSLHDVNYGTESDDAIYLTRATRVANEGLGILPDTFRQYIGDEKLWQLPSPVRIGYPVLCALVFRFVEPSYQALSCISIACWVATVMIQFVFARRRFGFERGVLIGLLTACSCLGLGLARLALLDGPVTPFLVLAAWLFLELVDAWDGGVEAARSARARTLLASAFVFSATAAILIKEPSVLLLPPLAAFFALERWGRRRPLPLAPAALVLGSPVVLSLAAWLFAAGGSGPFLETLRIVRETLATNAYAARLMSGPWYRYVLDFIVLSPWVTLAALSYFGVLCVRWRRGEYERTQAFLAALLAGLVVEFGAIEKNVRYLLVAEMALRVFALLFVWELFAALARQRRLLVASAIVGCVCWSELTSFQLIFVKYRTYETVSWNLFAVRHITPPRPGAGR